MNERIYTLAEQVGAIRWNDELNGNSIDFSPAQFEKFAELIVRECMKAADEGMAQVTMKVEWPSYHIKKHFGV